MDIHENYVNRHNRDTVLYGAGLALAIISILLFLTGGVVATIDGSNTLPKFSRWFLAFGVASIPCFVAADRLKKKRLGIPKPPHYIRLRNNYSGVGFLLFVVSVILFCNVTQRVVYGSTFLWAVISTLFFVGLTLIFIPQHILNYKVEPTGNRRNSG